MNNLESDIAKYRKKKDSSTSKSKAKSNHKHEIACLLKTEDHIEEYIANYAVKSVMYGSMRQNV